MQPAQVRDALCFSCRDAEEERKIRRGRIEIRNRGAKEGIFNTDEI
jgi:hypothetical protein